METKVVIIDKDTLEPEVIGILTVKDKTIEEINNTIDLLKYSISFWSWEDILNGLKERGFNFTWEERHIHTILI